MNLEQKSLNIVNILSREYANLIGLDGIGMYVFLMRIESVKMGVLDLKTVSFAVNLDIEAVAIIIKKLYKCGLIDLKSKRDNKYSVKTLDIKPISYTEKLYLLDELFKEKLVSYEEKTNISKRIHAIYNNYSPSSLQETEETEKIIKNKRKKKVVEEVDLLKAQRRRNPNSCPALVDDYYKAVSKYFGQYFTSRNVIQEAKMLKDNMRKYGDSPDNVRKLFDFIASQAKSRDEIDRVKQIDYYLKNRDVAYFNVFTNPSKPSAMLGSKKEEIVNTIDHKHIKEMYDFYKTKNLSFDIIKKRLEEQFQVEPVNNFLQTMVNLMN